MTVLYLLSFVAVLLVSVFGVICVACGLFFIAETVEVSPPHLCHTAELSLLLLFLIQPH
jgi:hypothetical protein